MNDPTFTQYPIDIVHEPNAILSKVKWNSIYVGRGGCCIPASVGCVDCLYQDNDQSVYASVDHRSLVRTSMSVSRLQLNNRCVHIGSLRTCLCLNGFCLCWCTNLPTYLYLWRNSPDASWVGIHCTYSISNSSRPGATVLCYAVLCWSSFCSRSESEIILPIQQAKTTWNT